MRKISVLLLSAALVLGIAGFSSALSFTDYKVFGDSDLGVLLGLGQNSGSFSWTHSTPADFEIPPDTVNSATITLGIRGINGENDYLLAEKVVVGTLTNSQFIWNWFDSYWINPTYDVDVANIFGSWTSGSTLDMTIAFKEPNGILNGQGFYLYSSTFRLDYENGSAPAPVPEPASMLLFGTGLIVFGFTGRKLKKK